MEHIYAPNFGEITKIRKQMAIEERKERFNRIVDNVIVLFSVVTFMNVAYWLSKL